MRVMRNFKASTEARLQLYLRLSVWLPGGMVNRSRYAKDVLPGGQGLGFWILGGLATRLKLQRVGDHMVDRPFASV